MKNDLHIVRSGGIRYGTIVLLFVLSVRAEGMQSGGVGAGSGRAAVSATPPDSTQYESTSSTPYEEAALIGANVMLIPLAIAATAVSVAPPSVGVLVHDGTAYATLGFETGLGIGAQRETGRFADARLMLSYVHVYNRHQPDLWRAEAVKDVHCCYIDRRKLFLLGAGPRAGLYARGAERGYSLGASVHLMIPSLPYFGFFPLHTVGMTYRYSRNFSGGEFHTVALGVAAAVTF